MNQETSISERMKKKQAEAEAAIKELLWKGDTDGAADAALRGGIDPAKVDKIAKSVEEAKATLTAAVTAHEQMPALTKTLSAATEQSRKAARALEKAQEAADESGGALHWAEQAAFEANHAIELATNAAQGGEIPDQCLPAWLATFVSQRRVDAEATAKAERITDLKRQIRWRQDRIEGLTSESEKLTKTRNQDREQVVTAGGRLVDARDALKGRLKFERERLKEAEAELEALEKTK